MREPTPDFLNAVNNIRPAFSIGRYDDVMSFASTIADALPPTGTNNSQLPGTVEQLILGARAAGRLGFSKTGERFFDLAFTGPNALINRFAETSESGRTFAFQKALALIDLGEFEKALRVLFKESGTTGGAVKRGAEDADAQRRAAVAIRLLQGTSQIGCGRTDSGYRLIDASLRGWDIKNPPNPSLLEFALQSADQIAATGSNIIARKLYKRVRNLVSKCESDTMPFNLRRQLLGRANAGLALSLQMNGEAEANDHSKQAQRGIHFHNLQPRTRLCCVLSEEVPYEYNIIAILQALDSARKAFSIVSDGLKTPLEWETHTRCNYVRLMLDVCFIIKEFAIASETFKDRSSRAAFERTFMNTLDKSEAMRIVLNDANIQCHEQPNNRLCVYLGALVSRCDVQLLDAKEVIDGAVNTSPFQRTVLHGTVDTLRDWLRHAFLPKNAQTGCACTAESVMEATYTVCAGAGHAEYLVQHARVLFNDGFVHEAAQVAAAASTVSTHPYICAEAELEHLLADHGGADPYGIPPSIGELVDEIKSTSNIIPARKIDLLAQIFFDLTLLTQGFEKDKPEYAFTTLTEICTERPYDQVPNALRSMRSWIENFDDSNWSPGELKDLASAFRALPEGFTLPESLWNEVFFNLSEGTPLSSPRTFASLIELLDEIRTYLQRSHIQVSHVQIQGDQTEDTSPLFQRLLTQRETRHAELTLLYGSLVGDHSRYFPSEEQLESARARVQSEQYTSLHIRALHLLTRTASVRQDHRTVFELCTKVFAITNAFSLHGVERAACSRILGEIAFEFVQELLEKQPKTRPTPTSIAQRLQSLQEHREIIEWFVPSPGIPQFLLTTDPKQPPSEPRDLIRIHHRLNSLARNLLIGPVAALLENGTIGAGGIDEIDAEEPMLRRCLKLCGDIF